MDGRFCQKLRLWHVISDRDMTLRQWGTAIVSLQQLKAVFRETQRWTSQSCTKYPAHMFSVWPLLTAGRGQSPASIPWASFLLLWVVSDLNKVGAICWSCRCSSSGQSPYLQPRPSCQGGWPRRGVQREYRWRTAADLLTRRPEHKIIIRYHKWAICMLNIWKMQGFLGFNLQRSETPHPWN